MKIPRIHLGRFISILLLVALLVGRISQTADAAETPVKQLKEAEPAPGDLDGVGQAIVALLQSKDAPRFGLDVDAVDSFLQSGLGILKMFFKSVCPNHHPIYGCGSRKGSARCRRQTQLD